MPLTLRRKLVDDQDWIIERKMVFAIRFYLFSLNNSNIFQKVIPSPRDPTVRLILNDYLASHGCPE